MKPIVCIFAHPDDEAFGPSGTIALLAEKHDVYLICVTDGSAGKCSPEEKHLLSEIRKKELMSSARQLGVKDVLFLGYKDGTLSNNLYHDIAEKISQILIKIKPQTLVTFEHRGISGHLDHIAVSMICSYVFEQLPFLKKIMYYCLTAESRALEEPYFIYFPAGYTEGEIDETYDVSCVWEKKLACMREHISQKHDADRVIRKLEKLPKTEHFYVVKK